MVWSLIELTGITTAQLAKEVFQQKNMLRLENAAEALHISVIYSFHDAFSDACYTAEILKRYIVHLLSIMSITHPMYQSSQGSIKEKLIMTGSCRTIAPETRF